MDKNVAVNNVSSQGNINNVMIEGTDNNKSGKSEYVNIIIRFVLHMIFYGLIIFAIASFADKAYEFAYQIYGDVSVEKEATLTRKIEIEPGDNTLSVATKLYDEGLIVNKYTFVIRMKLSGELIQPRTYTISNDMNYKEIIEKITDIEESEE